MNLTQKDTNLPAATNSRARHKHSQTHYDAARLALLIDEALQDADFAAALKSNLMRVRKVRERQQRNIRADNPC